MPAADATELTSPAIVVAFDAKVLAGLEPFEVSVGVGAVERDG